MQHQDENENWVDPVRNITGVEPSPLPPDLILRLTHNQSFQVIDASVGKILGVVVRNPRWIFIQATTHELPNDQYREIARIEEVLNLSARPLPLPDRNGDAYKG